MAFDVEGARKAGYSDAEIASHLAQESNFDIGGAKKAGYSDSDIVQHLVGSRAPTATAVPKSEKPPLSLDNMPIRAVKYVGDVLGNLGPNAMEDLSGMYHAVTNPRETYNAVSDLANSAAMFGAKKGAELRDKLGLQPYDPQTMARINAAAAPAEAVGSQIYNAVSDPVETFRNKPFSTLTAVAPMLRGAGTLAEAANLSRFGELPVTIGGTVKDITGAQVLNAAAKNPSDLLALGAPYALNKGVNALNTLGQTAGTVGSYIDPLNALGKVGGTAVKNVVNWLNPKNTTLLEMAEGNAPALVEAARNYKSDLGYEPTFSQATSEVGGTVLPAAEKKLSELMPTEYKTQQDAAQAARAAKVGEVAQTPEDLAKAIETRATETKPLYDQAKADTRMAAGRRDLNAALDDIIKANKANPPLVSMMEDIKNNVSTNVKQVRDVSSAIDHIDGLLSGTSDAFLKKQLMGIKDKMMTMIPGMAAADEAFAAASKPVNTMQVGQELERTLTPVAGEEAGRAFRKAMENPAATVEKATGLDYLKSIENVVGSENYSKLQSVAADLQKQEELAARASAGAKKANEILPKIEVTLPRALDRIVAVGNDIMRKIGGKIDRATAEQIAAGLLKHTTGADMFEEALRWKQRNQNIANKARELAPAAAVPARVNALSTLTNQNALAGQ
jgi:hypothetical protein